MHAFDSIAFFINETKHGAPELAAELIKIADQQCLHHRVTSKYPFDRDFLNDVSACCVIGGDGTLLGIAEECAKQSVPVIGINRGGLGFLTTFSGEEAVRLFPEVLKGNYCITERSMVQATASNGETAPALNDAMVATELVFITIGMMSSLTIAGSIRAAFCPRLLRVSGSRLKPPCSNNQQVGGFAPTFKHFLFFYS